MGWRGALGATLWAVGGQEGEAGDAGIFKDSLETRILGWGC